MAENIIPDLQDTRTWKMTQGRNKLRGPNSPANRDKQRKSIAVILKQLQSVYLPAVKCCTVREHEGLVLICITFICHLMTRDLPWAAAKSTFVPQSTPIGSRCSRRISSQTLISPYHALLNEGPNPFTDEVPSDYPQNLLFQNDDCKS